MKAAGFVVRRRFVLKGERVVFASRELLHRVVGKVDRTIGIRTLLLLLEEARGSPLLRTTPPAAMSKPEQGAQRHTAPIIYKTLSNSTHPSNAYYKNKARSAEETPALLSKCLHNSTKVLELIENASPYVQQSRLWSVFASGFPPTLGGKHVGTKGAQQTP